MGAVELHETIPNNVGLSSDKRLRRALEEWQPHFLAWWREMGPDRFRDDAVYLRTAVSVDASGWAHFDYVRMPEYRWGIFLAEPVADRRIGFGDDHGKPVWREVPGEHRNTLRRLIVTQGDTEPASVEQQRRLGASCPSLYDLRNLFQVNVEEGRHLWAMAYLLHTYFGRDGREEARDLLERRSGNPDKPRILAAFNEPIDDWLSFFMFTTFTDRDGKYQLLALAESGFDPLSRTCRFMLTEEAHHMFVGESGVGRIVERTAECLRAGTDARAAGALALGIMQRYLNFWYSLSLDLFGSEVSTNAAHFFGAGLKGRPREDERYDDHLALEGGYEMDVYEEGRLVRRAIPLRSAMNEVLRDAYVEDCQKALDRWNRRLDGTGGQLVLPSRRFHRHRGTFAGHFFDPAGGEITGEAFERYRDQWLPSEADRAYVRSLMAHPVLEPGHFASWIAPPARGINHQPIDFQYVRYNEE
ncbi:MAG: benzoyl-CoA 2,3-epoxidase subunit BoxB [Deltaproteobacteria bacterium]|nr:MAG: benzoyl-CoA 2,3-epoxidase subunit BoxB [Deltaproteobacteria bacterium]